LQREVVTELLSGKAVIDMENAKEIEASIE
jgi:hypothetical protein